MNYLRTLLLLIFFFFPFNISGQNVYFLADTTTGCDSLRVTFQFINATFPDTVSTVDWDFGNGQTEPEKGIR